VPQWVARLIRNVEVVGCFLEQETLHLLLSTGWFQSMDLEHGPRERT